MVLSVTHYGLIADIIGALLLFKYGLPSELASERGPSIIVEYDDDVLARIKKSNRKIRFWAKIGLTLLILGFLLQFIGSFQSGQQSLHSLHLQHAASTT